MVVVYCDHHAAVAEVPDFVTQLGGEAEEGRGDGVQGGSGVLLAFLPILRS